MIYFVVAVLIYFIVSFVINVLMLGAAISADDREQGMSAIFKIIIAIVWIIFATVIITFR